MRHSKLIIAAAAALLFNTLACQAQDKVPAAGHDTMSSHDGQGTHHGDGHGERDPHRCMHKGMMGNGAMPHMVPLPSLPPGNAKLELQMQAEILQKVGEILGKYAAQVKDAPPAP